MLFNFFSITSTLFYFLYNLIKRGQFFQMEMDNVLKINKKNFEIYLNTLKRSVIFININCFVWRKYEIDNLENQMLPRN